MSINGKNKNPYWTPYNPQLRRIISGYKWNKCFLNLRFKPDCIWLSQVYLNFLLNDPAVFFFGFINIINISGTFKIQACFNIIQLWKSFWCVKPLHCLKNRNFEIFHYKRNDVIRDIFNQLFLPRHFQLQSLKNMTTLFQYETNTGLSISWIPFHLPCELFCLVNYNIALVLIFHNHPLQINLVAQILEHTEQGKFFFLDWANLQVLIGDFSLLCQNPEFHLGFQIQCIDLEQGCSLFLRFFLLRCSRIPAHFYKFCLYLFAARHENKNHMLIFCRLNRSFAQTLFKLFIIRLPCPSPLSKYSN